MDFETLSTETISTLSTTSATLDRAASARQLLLLSRNDPAKYFDELAGQVADAPFTDPMIAIRLCEAFEGIASLKRIGALEGIISGQTNDISFRICAMDSIRRLKVPHTVPFLVKTLNDENLYLSQLALITLADITDKSGDYGPGMQLFRTDPDKYRALWRSWWQQTGSKEGF